MSKEKLLASAQKFIDKAQIAKAIKDYEQIVQLDARDMRHRQKLAELYGRQNMTKEAFGSFQMVANSFTETGFYLKAIAVYKQMLKLEPDRIELYERLAELNEKQGLTGNALGEYRSLALLLEKAKRYDDAAAILQKMKKIDPENVSIRTKIVGFLVKSDETDEARQEFAELLTLLAERQDNAGLLHLREQFASLLQQQAWVGKDLGQALLRLGEVEHGQALLRELLVQHGNDAEILQALADSHPPTGIHANTDIGDEFPVFDEIAPPPDNVPPTSLASPTPAMEPLHEEVIEEIDVLEELEELDGEVEGELLGAEEDFEAEEIPLAFLESMEEPPPSEIPAADVPVSSSASMDIELDLDADFDLETDFAGEADPEVVEDQFPPLEAEAEIELVLELEDLGEGLAHPTEEVELELESEDLELELASEELELEGEELELEGEELELEGEELELELELGGEELELELENVLMPTETADSDFACPQNLANDGSKAAEALAEELEVDFTDFDPTAGEIELELAPEDEEALPPFDLLQLDEEAEEPDLPPTSTAADLEWPDEDAVAVPLDSPFGETDTELADFPLDLEPFADDPPLVTEDILIAEDAEESPMSEEDGESHFSLGIAYKEMGLLNDAVAEFGKAMRHRARLVDALSLKGICLAESGATEKAEENFQAGLQLPNLNDEEKVCLHYELGLLYEGWGRPAEALEEFQRVAETDQFFREVQDKMVSLRQMLGVDESGAKKTAGRNRVSFV